MQGILFLGNKMQDATSQDLNPMSREDTPQSWSGEDSPGSYIRKDSWYASILYQERTVDTQSYIRRGQWTHLNPGSGENSEHTSILVRRGYLHIRRGHTSILCQYGRETSRSLIIIGRPRLQAPRLWRWVEKTAWLWSLKGNKPGWGTRRNVKKCQQTKRC